MQFIDYSLLRTMAWRKRGRDDLNMIENLSKKLRKESTNGDETKFGRGTEDQVNVGERQTVEEKDRNSGSREGDGEARDEGEEAMKRKIFEQAKKRSSPEDRIWELLFFMRTLPPYLPSSIKDSLIKQVKTHLMIEGDEKMLYKSPATTPSSREWYETPLLDALSTMLGFNLKVIAPPTNVCLNCHSALSAHRDPTQVRLHTRLGTHLASKYILRCRHCSYRYHPTRYGTDRAGWKFYSNPGASGFIEASTVTYVEESLAKLYSALYLHGWLSAVAMCAAFNWANRDSYFETKTRLFLKMNPEVGKLFNSSDREEDEDQEEKEDSKCLMYQMSRKSLSQNLLNYEMREELRESGELEKVSFGPKEVSGRRVSFKESQEQFFEEVDLRRKDSLYPHEVCYEGCKRRGCEKVSTFDGLWKIQVFHEILLEGD